MEVSVCAAWKPTFSPFIWGESMDADMSVLMADHPTLDLTGVSLAECHEYRHVSVSCLAYATHTDDRDTDMSVSLVVTIGLTDPRELPMP